MTKLPKQIQAELLEAALDQPAPTQRLRDALQAALRAAQHEDALR